MNQTNNEFLEKMREIIKEELSKIDVRKMSFDRCINNIIVILENYKTLKQFTAQVENVKFSKEEIDQAKQKELERMMEEVFASKEIYLESLYKKHLQTQHGIRPPVSICAGPAFSAASPSRPQTGTPGTIPRNPRPN